MYKVENEVDSDNEDIEENPMFGNEVVMKYNELPNGIALFSF
jgi:hypothetical protein